MSNPDAAHPDYHADPVPSFGARTVGQVVALAAAVAVWFFTTGTLGALAAVPAAVIGLIVGVLATAWTAHLTSGVMG